MEPPECLLHMWEVGFEQSGFCQHLSFISMGVCSIKGTASVLSSNNAQSVQKQKLIQKISFGDFVTNQFILVHVHFTLGVFSVFFFLLDKETWTRCCLYLNFFMLNLCFEKSWVYCIIILSQTHWCKQWHFCWTVNSV